MPNLQPIEETSELLEGGGHNHGHGNKTKNSFSTCDEEDEDDGSGHHHSDDEDEDNLLNVESDEEDKWERHNLCLFEQEKKRLIDEKRQEFKILERFK